MFAKKGVWLIHLNVLEKAAYGTRFAIAGEYPERNGGSTWFRAAKVVAHGREAPFPGCSLRLRLRRLKANSYLYSKSFGVNHLRGQNRLFGLVYIYYLGTLEEYRGEYGVKVYGFCLMTNHVHLIFNLVMR
jgi:hypothetical protein